MPRAVPPPRSFRPAVRRRLLLEASRQAHDQQQRRKERAAEMPGRMSGRIHGPPASSSHGPSRQAHVPPQPVAQQDNEPSPGSIVFLCAPTLLINEPVLPHAHQTTRQVGSDPSWTRGEGGGPHGLDLFPLSLYHRPRPCLTASFPSVPRRRRPNPNPSLAAGEARSVRTPRTSAR